VILIAFLLFFAERFVWDVRVTGNVTMTESEVIEELRACGFGVGSYIPSVHASALENRVLLASDRISWISVYLEGTVARVQVIEQAAAPPPIDTSRPANLVAAVDGQIELIELYRGNCVVKIGQAVRAGDLLVSGLYDSSLYGYRYTRAAGRILARTERTLRVEIPLSYTEKVYESEKCDEINLKFFDYSLKVFKSVGNGTDTCDIIKEEINLNLLGSHTLPLGITVTKRIGYTEREAVRSPETALSLAYAELARELASLSERVDVIGKTICTEIGEESLILECRLSCIEDIAVQTEFEMIE
jgi:similar to stage IV sporulation protein